jgi:hypothetical protein
MNYRPIHFLVYLNRSGSTLLAKELNKLKDIAVGIEEGISSSVDNSFQITDEAELRTFIDDCYKDYKFKSWKLDRDELFNKLYGLEYPIDYSVFLSTALEEYFKDDPAKVLIHKSRTFYSQIGKESEMFPESKSIIMIRDPRAIFSSQRKSVDSRTGEIMNDDVINFCVSYKRVISKLNHLIKSKKARDRVLPIKYENLVSEHSFHQELTKITDFLNVSPVKSKGGDNYFNKIPEEQKHLHANVAKKPLHNRIDAWKEELPTNDSVFIKCALKKEIRKFSYNRLTPKVNISDFVSLYKRLFSFYVKFYPKHLLKKTLLFFGFRKVY